MNSIAFRAFSVIVHHNLCHPYIWPTGINFHLFVLLESPSPVAGNEPCDRRIWSKRLRIATRLHSTPIDFASALNLSCSKNRAKWYFGCEDEGQERWDVTKCPHRPDLRKPYLTDLRYEKSSDQRTYSEINVSKSLQWHPRKDIPGRLNFH